MKHKFVSILFFLLFSAGAFSQTEGYLYKRKLNKADKENFYSIPLLPEIVANCKSNLNDIRIYNYKEKDTAEVPYILEWMGTKNQETTIPFELINDTFNQKCCSYVTLKFNKQQTINRIKLDVSDANFDKWVKIEGSSNNKTWFTIKERLRIVRFQNEGEHFEYTTLDFQNTEYTYYRLKFDDDASKRITVTNAYAFETKETPGNYTEVKVNSKTRTENKKEKTSEIIIELAANYKIDHIVIKSNATKDFYRNLNLYRLGEVFHTPKGDKENWYIVNTSIFSSVENNAISCNNEQTKKFKIEVSNYSDEPIEISEVKVFAEQCRLLTELPVSDNIYMVYGKANDNAPSYDLIHFKEKIPSSITEINYATEQVTLPATLKSQAPIENKNWLWIAMSGIILLIGFFALRMLKKEGE
jgi:hypothetical protein